MRRTVRIPPTGCFPAITQTMVGSPVSPAPPTFSLCASHRLFAVRGPPGGSAIEAGTAASATHSRAGARLSYLHDCLYLMSENSSGP